MLIVCTGMARVAYNIESKTFMVKNYEIHTSWYTKIYYRSKI